MRKYARTNPEDWKNTGYLVQMNDDGIVASFDITGGAIPSNEERTAVMINRGTGLSEHYTRLPGNKFKCYRFTRHGNFLDCTEVQKIP